MQDFFFLWFLFLFYFTCKREIKIKNRPCVPHTRRSKTKPARSLAHTMGRAYTATREEDNARTFFLWFLFLFYFTCKREIKIENWPCVPHTHRSKTKPARSSAHTMGRAYTCILQQEKRTMQEEKKFFGFYFYFTLRAKQKLKLRTGRVSHTPAARKLNQHGAQPTPWGERILQQEKRTM